MKKHAAWFVIGAAVLVGGRLDRPIAAPAPALKADQWEYCELQQTSRLDRGGRGGFNPRADPTQPDQPPVQIVPNFHFVTGDVELSATTWQELAEKMKIPEGKKAATTATGHKVRILNHLGSQGWEMVSGGSGTSTSWIFKRKAVK